jgi:hypothetical protein
MRYAILLAPLLALLILACREKDQAPAVTSTATEAVTEQPTAADTEEPSAEVPAEVQAVIDAALSGDPAELLTLVQYTTIPCAATSEGIGGPPTCRQGEADGTSVDVLPVGTCEGELRRPDEIGDTLALLSDISLYAVYRWPAEQEPPGEYAAMFARTGPTGEALAVELVIEDGRLVRLKFGCGETPAQLVQFQGLEDVILPPQP